MRKLRPQAREPHRPHVRRLSLPKISTHLRLGWRGFYTNAKHTHPLQPPRLRRVGQLGAMRCPGPLKDEWISPLTTAPTPHTHTHTHLLPECLPTCAGSGSLPCTVHPLQCRAAQTPPSKYSNAFRSLISSQVPKHACICELA